MSDFFSYSYNILFVRAVKSPALLVYADAQARLCSVCSSMQ